MFSALVSMMETEQPREISGWLTICPNRPKPTIRALPARFSASSTPSIETVAFGPSRSNRITASGVTAMDRITVAVRTALVVPSMMPTLAAAA